MPIIRGNVRNSSKRDGIEPALSKQVGKFKGIVKITNTSENEELELTRTTKMNILKETIEDLHTRLFGKPLNFNYEKLTTQEGRDQFTLIMT